MKLQLFTLLFVISCACAVRAQIAPEPILGGTAKSIMEFHERFRDLLADELKTFEEFDKKGQPKDKTTVLSSFLVYRSGKSTTTAELRNVREVNGKPVPDSQKRGEKFLAELERVSTPESELRKLVAESAKYDTTWSAYGLTLNQAVALEPNLRRSFTFTVAGMSTIDGDETYEIVYEQTAQTPYIAVNKKPPADNKFFVGYDIDLPRSLKKAEFFLRGKLWIDKKTSRVRREVRELVARSPEPLRLISTDFTYAPSTFGIYLPQSVTTEIYGVREEGDSKAAVLRTRFSLGYSNYRRTEVEVKILDEETPVP